MKSQASPSPPAFRWSPIDSDDDPPDGYEFVGQVTVHNSQAVTLLLSGAALALHLHRNAFDCRMGGYNPDMFGRRSFWRGHECSNAQRMAGRWLSRHNPQSLPAHMMRSELPHIAYRLASGDAHMLGPVGKLP